MKLSQPASMLLLLLGTCFVGAVAIFTKLASTHMQPLHFILCLYLFSLPFSLPIGTRWKMSCSKQIARYFFQHVFGIALGWYLFTSGVKTVDATTAAFTGRLEFFFLTMAGFFLLKEKFDKYFVFAFLLAVTGLLFIYGLPFKHDFTTDHGGTILIALSSMGFATGEFASKKLAVLTPLRTFLFWRNLFLVAFFTIIYFLNITEPIQLFRTVPMQAYLYVLGCAFFGPVCARLLYSKAMQTVPLSRISLFAQLEPFTTMVLAYLFAMELPNFTEYAGGFFLMLGCLVIWIQEQKKGPTKAALK